MGVWRNQVKVKLKGGDLKASQYLQAVHSNGGCGKEGNQQVSTRM